MRLEKKEEVKEEKKEKERVAEDSNKPDDETDYKPQHQEGSQHQDGPDWGYEGPWYPPYPPRGDNPPYFNNGGRY